MSLENIAPTIIAVCYSLILYSIAVGVLQV
jgi:hypothetical protein